MNKVLKLSLAFMTGVLTSELTRIILIWLKKTPGSHSAIADIINEDPASLSESELKLNARKPPGIWNTVIFFPQPEGAALTQLLYFFENARIRIQLCIFLSSLREIYDVIRRKRRDGLHIQAITDYDTLTAHNNYNCIDFIKSGIQVRAKNTGFLMHNKFVIIDDEAVLTGSLNYTRQAVTNNSENVVVTTNEKIVQKYREEFKKIWVSTADFRMKDLGNRRN